MKYFLSSIEDALKPLSITINNVVSELRQTLKPVTKAVNAYEEEKRKIICIIDNENISFSDKISQLPKIDPEVHLAYLLLENIVQKKLNSEKWGTKLWQELYEHKDYKERIESHFNNHWKDKSNYVAAFYGLSDKESSFRNATIHEIGDLRSNFIELCLNGYKPSIKEMENFYNFIKSL